MKNMKKRDWDNWEWQLNNSESLNTSCHDTAINFPVAVTPYYASLIKQSDIPNDPIYKQAFPDKKELNDKSQTPLIH